MDKIPTPTPLTKEQLVEMQKQHELERQKRLLTYDNTTVLAKLHYYKGTIAVASTDSITHKQFSDVVTGWNSVVMVGTQRQICADDTVDNITGTYTLNLTDKMLKAYKENNNQLIIIK
tara:strand:+ start:144 stop:497 length:354 start_codon:yes stop_codon:yes gene_type:complete